MKNKKTFLIYVYYFLSFLGSISFFVIANFLQLENLEKYIFILSISTIFASTIYSSSIKSKLENNIIKINFTTNTVIVVSVIFIFVCLYLILNEDYFLTIFFILTIIYEVCFNLFSISFVKRNKTLNHSLLLLITSFFKNLSLLLFLIFLDLLKIISIFYILYSLFFMFNYKKLNIVFKPNQKSFNIIDFFYILTGTLIFQIDKIFGESLLSKNNYITYFLIFKCASTFQIIGSLLTQPIRNEMISTERVSGIIKKNLGSVILILISLLILANILLLPLSKINFFNQYIFEIDIINILVFNFISMCIITHIYNGFYIDALFINNNGRILLMINSIIIFFIATSLIIFKSLVVWSLTMLIAQIIMLLISISFYKKYV